MISSGSPQTESVQNIRSKNNVTRKPKSTNEDGSCLGWEVIAISSRGQTNDAKIDTLDKGPPFNKANGAGT